MNLPFITAVAITSAATSSIHSRSKQKIEHRPSSYSESNHEVESVSCYGNHIIGVIKEEERVSLRPGLYVIQYNNNWLYFCNPIHRDCTLKKGICE